MVLSSSSPVIENCQRQGRGSVSDAISAIEVPTSRQCTHYVDDLLLYEPLCNYWASGQVFIVVQAACLHCMVLLSTWFLDIFFCLVCGLLEIKKKV